MKINSNYPPMKTESVMEWSLLQSKNYITAFFYSKKTKWLLFQFKMSKSQSSYISKWSLTEQSLLFSLFKMHLWEKNDTSCFKTKLPITRQFTFIDLKSSKVCIITRSPLASLINMAAYTPSRERNESGLFFFSDIFKIMLSTVS